MNPILSVLVDAQVKSFQRRTRTGKVAQVKSFQRQGQQSKSPQEKSHDRQSAVMLRSKITPEERKALLDAAKKAKTALSKSSNKSGFKLARAFYQMKNQLMSKYGANGNQQDNSKQGNKAA